MKQSRRMLSIILTIVICIGVLPISMNAEATSNDASIVVNLAISKIGTTRPNHSCLAFVKEMFAQAYGFTSSACCAYKYGSNYIDSTSRNDIPIGADVFFGGSNVICSGKYGCGNKAGHVGIYVGDDCIVHAWAGKVVKYKIDRVINAGYPYRGWGWHNNYELSNTPPDINPDHYPFPTRNIGYYGSAMKGDDVGWVQAVLYQLGYFTNPYDIDKSFGPGTKGVVQRFQRDNGLDDDGSVGPLTRAKLNERWIIKRDGEQVFNPTLEATSYLGNHRYEFYKGKTSWTNARDYAESIGGHLITISSENETNILTSFGIDSSSTIWIGATDEASEGNWKWVTGESFDYTNWADGEPNGSSDDEDFAEAYANGKWNDYRDSSNPSILGFIVEFEEAAVLDSTLYLNGHTYQFYKGFLPWTSAREYAESLGGYLMTVTSEQEQNLLAQYNAVNPTSELWLGASDAVSEGNWQWITGESFSYENWADEEPNNSNSLNNPENYLGVNTTGCWNDYSDSSGAVNGFIVEYEPVMQDIVQVNGHIYVLYGINTSWHSAKAFAEAQGGHLATIADEAEENTIEYFVSELTGSVWIGATDEVDEGQWKWVTGEPFSYTNWNDGEPNNVNDGEDWIEFYSNGKWNDVPAVHGNVCGFVVEYEPGCYTCAEDDHTWGDGVYQTPDGCPENSAILYTCELCGAEKHDYVVTYDAQDGTGAPEQQIKSEGFDLTLSDDCPTKPGYSFIGWSTSPDSVIVNRAPGSVYSENAPLTLYALYRADDAEVFWGDVNGDGEITSADAQLVLKFYTGSKTPTQVQMLLADVDLSGEIDPSDAKYIAYDEVRKLSEYPAEKLAEFSFTAPHKTTYSSGDELDTAGMQIVAANKNDSSISYVIDEPIVLSGYDMSSHGTQTVTATWRTKSFSFQITVGNKVSGDINGDNTVNNKDLTRLMKYLAGEDVVVNEAALDINGDGTVNNKDLTRLMKYLAGESVEIY